MSFLDSLLDSVEAPPSASTEEKARQKAVKDAADKVKKVEQKRLQDFETKVWSSIKKFSSDPSQHRLFFAPMDNVFRGIIHDVSGTHNLVSHAFGQEEVDRAVVVFKQSAAPTPGQLQMMDRALSYKECMADLRAKEKARDEAAAQPSVKDEPKAVAAPVSTKRIEKMEKLLARATPSAPQTTYGLVHVSQHVGNETVEDRMNKLQAKRQKVEE